MATASESREITIPYKNHHIAIDEYKIFGWQLVHKVILNSFGGPAITEDIDENFLNAGYHVKLTFSRYVEEENLKELTDLQIENDKLVYVNETFNNSFITGTVFMTLASIASYASASAVNDLKYRILLILNGLVIGGFIAWIYIGNCRARANAHEHNEEVRQKKMKIFEKAQKLL